MVSFFTSCYIFITMYSEHVKFCFLVLAGWYSGLECPRCTKRFQGHLREPNDLCFPLAWMFLLLSPLLSEKAMKKSSGEDNIPPAPPPFWSLQKFPSWQNSNDCSFACEKKQVFPPQDQTELSSLSPQPVLAFPTPWTCWRLSQCPRRWLCLCFPVCFYSVVLLGTKTLPPLALLSKLCLFLLHLLLVLSSYCLLLILFCLISTRLFLLSFLWYLNGHFKFPVLIFVLFKVFLTFGS